MKDISSRLSSAVEEYGASFGVTQKNAKRASVGELEFPKGFHALRATRDVLVEVGDVLEEDLPSGVYVAAVKAGAGNANAALVVALIEGNKVSLAACAKEGLIKQATAKKAIERIARAAQEYADA